MRKIFTAIFALLALVSCNNATSELDAPTKYKRVTITVNGARSGAITKATDDEVQAALSQVTLTQSMSLRLTSKKTGTAYAVTVGEAVDLPVGEYTVYGEYTPPVIKEAYNAFIFSEPCFYVEQDLAITEGVDTYTVDAIYLCAALAFDMTVTSKVEHRVESRSFEELSLSGDVPVVFARCTAYSSNDPYKVRVTSTNPLFTEPTEYSVIWVESGTGLHVQDGYWYLLTPDVPATTSGTLSLAMTAWQRGEQ